jgi:DNA-binding beta-propeller fold protein YncE
MTHTSELAMRRNGTTKLLTLIFALTVSSAIPTIAQVSGTQAAQTIHKLNLGGDGRWDYLVVDPDAKRLYIARSTRFMVVNTETGDLVGEIADTPGAHGVALAPDLGIGFTSNGLENRASVFDLKTLKVTKKIETGQNPDAILYHTPTHSVFAFNGQSHSATVIDAVAQVAVATIPLAGKPEFAVADDKGNIYVNIADKNTMTVIDARTRKVKAVWPLAPCDEPTGLAIDRNTGTGFASCGNKLLAVVDLSTGEVRQTVAIGDDCDAVAYDPTTNLVFASNGEGTLTVIGKDRQGSYSVRQTLTTQPGSKTMALDPSTQRLYIPAAKFTGPPTQKPRPKVVPGSFEIWVISGPTT